MSQTIIYAFDKKGEVKYSKEINNAFHGAWAIWANLEEKYLPSLEKPDCLINKEGYYSRLCISPFGKEENPLKPIWDLWCDERPTFDEKIVLGTTFDKVLIKVENIQKVIKAFRNMDFKSSLPEQAEKIEELLKFKDVSAIGFNQNSVCSEDWSNGFYEDEDEDGNTIPYNHLNDDKHWYLFEKGEELNK